MRGIAYGVGVGPGDPELMTQKAIRLIRENRVIAVPGKVAQESVAYQIAITAVPEIAEKELVPIFLPMIKDREQMNAEHIKGAKLLEQYLDQGRNVVYLTLGDPTIYCTFSYLQHILERDGYPVELVPGVTSFCAAAARLNLTLVSSNESLHIVPDVYKTSDPLNQPGTYVLMKSASHMAEVKELLRESRRQICAVENCGMATETVFHSLDELPDVAGYFSLIIAKEQHE
ncbi:MAG: precorrin-2 C(20)-methyltransferase [Oscillospiraceae bacterium]|nr:precorrin-2 C(20)-methyltransferase [Oscillospiraceae bacterium]